MFWHILIISLIEKRLEGDIDLTAMDFFIFYDWLIVAAPWQMINSPVVDDYLDGSEAFPDLYLQVFDGLRDCCNSLEILGLKNQSQSFLSFACSLFLVHEEYTFSKNEDMTL